jgi:ADP-heptose:LPS heptosyltransferase
VSTQTDIIDRVGSGSRIVIIRLRSLGDCVLTTPALGLLKQARPDLEIAVVAEDRFAPVFERHPAVNCILPPQARALRAYSPELCLNLHGGTRSARLTLLSRARFRAGFDIFRPGWIYNTTIPTAQKILGLSRRVHTVEHLASAIFYLGVPISDVPRAQLNPPAGRAEAAPHGPFAVIHATAAMPEKTWPADRFLELAEHLRRRLDLEPVFIGGADDDLAVFSAYRTVRGASLTELMQLIRDAAFFAGNDSGPAHIAAAFGVPQIVLFGPSDEEVWAPWRTPAEILKAAGPIDSITVAQAIQALGRLPLTVRTS